MKGLLEHLLLGAVGEEKTSVPLDLLGKFVNIGVLFGVGITAKGDLNNFIFSNDESV